MIAPSFVSTSATGKFTLADLQVSGYVAPVWDEDNEEVTDGTGVAGGDFVMVVLNQQGSADARYYYIDDGNGHKGWYLKASGAEAADTSVEYDIGQAFWIQGKGKSLTSAGAVNPLDVVYSTRSAGSTAVGNATPIDLTLGKLAVVGYADPVWDEDNEEVTDGTGVAGGDFVVVVLNYQGSADARYYYIDDGNGHKGWYLKASGAEAADATTSIPAGQGLWVQGKGKSLYIPAPEGL